MRRARGFTLIEILVVLIIFGIVLTMAAAVTRGLAATQKRSITATRMATVDAAIVQFVAVQKRMPCPADGSLPSTANNAGLEAGLDGNGCSAQVNGIVPWISLGLTETDAADGWDRRFTYRTGQSLGLTMDMSQCDSAGTFGAVPPGAATCGSCPSGSPTNLAVCTPPQVFLYGKGLRVKNVAGTVLMEPLPAVPAITPATGAAYVLISPGETGGGGYLFNTGSLSASTTTDGTEEQKNYANGALQAYYVDDSLNDTAGASHFDDIVSRPSVFTMVTKAALGPRSH